MLDLDNTHSKSFMDIEVVLRISSPHQKPCFLQKRWSLVNSPFWISRPPQRPSTVSYAFSHYPHTGDSSRVIWVQSIAVFIEFTSEKTKQSSQVIHVKGGDLLFFDKYENPVYPDFSQEELVKALVGDEWCRY